MTFFEFLAQNYKVETILGLCSFIFSAFLGFLAYNNSLRMKKVSSIISIANSKNKANLTTAMLEILPSYKLPDLNQENGFKIIKMDMEQKMKKFEINMKLLRLGIILFTGVIILLIIPSYIKFNKTKIETYGKNSPGINGNGTTINYNTTETSNNSTESMKDTVKD